MNAFIRHGINHLSVSTVGLFAAEPALFVAEKLMKRRGKVGAAAHRGTAAEAGIVKGLLDPAVSIAECQAEAVKEFDRLTAFSADSRRDKERTAVPAIVATALPELRGYGVPDVVQGRIERVLPGVPVPWLGFLDLAWTAHGITLDIKSSLKLASEISTPHNRQISLYIYGTNHEGRIAYCTPNKIGVYRATDMDQHIAALVNIAQRLERFLSLSDDPMVLAGVVCPNVDSFYYSEPATRAMAKELFGL